MYILIQNNTIHSFTGEFVTEEQLANFPAGFECIECPANIENPYYYVGLSKEMLFSKEIPQEVLEKIEIEKSEVLKNEELVLKSEMQQSLKLWKEAKELDDELGFASEETLKLERDYLERKAEYYSKYLM